MYSPPVQGDPILEPMNKKGVKQAKKGKPGKKKIGAAGPVSGGSSRKGKEPAMEMAPVALSRRVRIGMPDVSGSPYAGDGRVRIRHREYLADVAGSVAFANTAFAINPGLAASFPWLSAIAVRFESYIFRRLRFEYETQRSTATNGTVMMAVDFDAADAAPTTKTGIMSYHNAVRSAVWDECCYNSDAGDLRKFGVQRFIRSAGLAANLDIKTYDVGNLNIATQGEADTTAIGELYVEYDVELITPQT